MTTPARTPSRVHPAIYAVIIAICLVALITAISYAIPLKLAGQAYLTIVILLAYRYWPPMFRKVASMPVAHRVVFGVLIGAMILGHYTLNGRTYFPFVTWEIFPFVHEDDPVLCREFIGTPNEGPKVRLLVEQLFPSIVQIDPLDILDNPHYYPPGTTEALARTLAKAYNERHPDNPIWCVDLMQLAVKLHPPPGETRSQPSCELLQRYDISSAP
jgi:hypothetical protein